MFKSRLLLALAAALSLGISSGFAAEPTSAESAYKDIEATFGLVPSHLKAYPPSAIGGAWDMTKGLLFARATRSSPR